jgi:hypothetical protein
VALPGSPLALKPRLRLPTSKRPQQGPQLVGRAEVVALGHGPREPQLAEDRTRHLAPQIHQHD